MAVYVKYDLSHIRFVPLTHELPHVIQDCNLDITTLLSCQPRVTVTSCFAYKVIRDL